MERMQFRRNIAEALELPKEIILDLPLISLLGSEEVSVENHKGILMYSEECIRISTKVGTLCVEGKHMGLKQLSGDILVMKGQIESLKFFA